MRLLLFYRTHHNNNSGSSPYNADWKKLFNLTELAVLEFKRKAVIYKEDAIPRGAYIVVKGKVIVTRTNEEGKSLVTGVYGEGDIFGYDVLIRRCNYMESAHAIEDSELGLIGPDHFLTSLYNDRELSARFIRLLSVEVDVCHEHMIHRAYDPVRVRVAAALLSLCEDPGTGPVTVRISREDLAHIAGTAVETVTRMLGEFKDENLITMKGSRINIPDRELVARLLK